MSNGKTYRVVISQGGQTRTVFTKADGTVNAIWQILGDMKTGDGAVSIVARPHVSQTPLEELVERSAEGITLQRMEEAQ